MEIKIFLLISFFQFILFSCYPVKYYPSLISRYSEEVKVYPQVYSAVGFILNVEDFKTNEEIFIRITVHSKDNEDSINMDYYYNFESQFDISENTLITNSFQNIEKKSITTTTNHRTKQFFTIRKSDDSKQFLKFIVVTNKSFRDDVGFKNTKEDESKKAMKELITILIIFFVCIFIIIGVVIAICCFCSHKRNRRTIMPIVNNQMYGQPMYGQPMYGQPMYGQQIYGQQIYGQQMYGQQMNNQQMYNQEQNNLGNNMNFGNNQQIYVQPMNGQQMYNQEQNNLGNNQQYLNNNMNPNEITPINEKVN